MATILVIDDEPHIVTLVATKLRNAGHTVLTAPDGQEGLRLVRERRPDVVVVDVMMPKIDGYTVCRTVREDLGSGPVIVLLSARSQLADRNRGMDAGADDYIVKPLGPARLLNRREELLRIRRSV